MRLLGEEGSGPDPDQWDGYPASAARCCATSASTAWTNLVVLSGDVHVAIVAGAPPRTRPTGEAPIAVELVTPSLTSMNIDDKMGWPRRDPTSRRARTARPSTRCRTGSGVELDSHGYVVVDVDPRAVAGRVVVRGLGARALDARGARGEVAGRARQSSAPTEA